MMSVAELVYRFFVGGLVVSLFAILAGVIEPTSFAGLFGAAPSVALATLGLTIAKDGSAYASVECRSMMAGAAALWLYSLLTSRLLLVFHLSALVATLLSLAAWFGCAFLLYFIFLK